MKKLSYLMFAFVLCLSACGEYNDKALQQWVDNLETRIEQLEELCRQMNTNIASLQTLVEASQSGDTITSVVPVMRDGEVIGYTITFTKNTPITIFHGTNGKDGADGEPGADGKPGSDGRTPEIGVAEEEGIYYWTVDGQWLLVDGERVPAQGRDGADGEPGQEGRPGADGKDGATPQLKIEEGYWWVSTDQGATWNRIAEAGGGSGEFFRDVTEEEHFVRFTLANGTVLEIPKSARLRIDLAVQSCALTAGSPVEVAYTLVNAVGQTQVEALGDQVVKAAVKASSSTEGVVTLLTREPEAIDAYTRVLLFATDDSRTAMAALTFECGELHVAEAYETGAGEGVLTVPVRTNLDYSVTIEPDAREWISRVETRAVRVDSLLFRVAANTGAARSALVSFESGSEKRTLCIAQAAGGEEPSPEIPPVTGTVELDRLYGYAEGTTGGEGATAAHTHHFDNGDKFREWLALREKNKDKTPAIAYLSGTFTAENGRAAGSPWFDIKDTENLSIYGTEGFTMDRVGFFLNRAANIVIRNIHIRMPKADNGADGISMQKSSRVWVDHCTFESMNQTHDYEDGSCDVTHETCNVTVSWCRFIRTQKSCLVGHSNSASGDTRISVTFHHNFFDLSSSRHPRVRFGRAHVYNNFFNQVTTYGVGSAYGAMVLVEDNLFDGVQLPTDICTFPAKPSGSSWVSNLQGSVAGYLYERGNVFLNRPDKAIDPYPFTNVAYKAYDGERLPTPYVYEDFKPAYAYVVDPAADLAAIVPAGAGAGKLEAYASAPVEVDNGGMTTTDPDPDPEQPETPAGTDLGNGWTLFDCGSAAATVVPTQSGIAMTAQGKFESGAQTFGYVCREVTGDFTATVEVTAYDTPGTSNQSLAGLLLTSDPGAEGTNLLHCMAAQGPAGAFYRSVRTAAGNASRGALTTPSATGGVAVLRVQRSGNDCSLSYSLDGGATFGKARTETFPELPESVWIGLAVNSGNNTKPATAAFDNLTIDDQRVSFAQ